MKILIDKVIKPFALQTECSFCYSIVELYNLSEVCLIFEHEQTETLVEFVFKCECCASWSKIEQSSLSPQERSIVL